MDIVTQRYIELAGAVVKKEVDEYKRALMQGKERKIAKCERFFLSEYGQLLSMNHGECIIRRCKEEVEREKANGREKNVCEDDN